MFVTLEEIKQQLQIDPADTEDDALLNRLGAVASEQVEADCNRKIYATQAAKDADATAPEDSIVINERVKHAALLLISHFFENRSATTEDALKYTPFAYRALIDPIRVLNL